MAVEQDGVAQSGEWTPSIPAALEVRILQRLFVVSGKEGANVLGDGSGAFRAVSGS
jgi:hypothetical protein